MCIHWGKREPAFILLHSHKRICYERYYKFQRIVDKKKGIRSTKLKSQNVMWCESLEAYLDCVRSDGNNNPFHLSDSDCLHESFIHLFVLFRIVRFRIVFTQFASLAFVSLFCHYYAHQTQKRKVVVILTEYAPGYPASHWNIVCPFFYVNKCPCFYARKLMKLIFIEIMRTQM